MNRVFVTIAILTLLALAGPVSAQVEPVAGRQKSDMLTLDFEHRVRPLDAIPEGRMIRRGLAMSEDSVIAPLMQHDATFDLSTVPLSDWLAGDARQVSWRVRVEEPKLRLDQRMEIPYNVQVRGKDLNESGTAADLVFISGISGPDGMWLADPKVVVETYDHELPDDLYVRFVDSVFVQPGVYQLWLVLFDRASGRYSVHKEFVNVTGPKGDPLPGVTTGLPIAEFPPRSDRDGSRVLLFSGPLSLPVTNERPITVELVTVVSAPEQWSDEPSLIRTHKHDVLSAVSTLSQLDLADGSVSITGLNLVHHKLEFEEDNARELDWLQLAQTFKNLDTSTVSAAALEGRKRSGAFFREFLEERLAAQSDAVRVLIVVASSLQFERGSDLDPIRPAGECACRTYHIRFRHKSGDVFDDLNKILKDLQPRTFNIASPLDFRKALAEIIRDLENL